MPKIQTFDRKREKERIASEFLFFRQTNLLRQVDLAEELKISRRSVQMVEAGITLPGMRTRKRFLELKEKLAKEQAEA